MPVPAWQLLSGLPAWEITGLPRPGTFIVPGRVLGYLAPSAPPDEGGGGR
ncbi:MAG: hypothetical protein J2P25_12235 [Nocardiopsaceae bacterium]|nr:hypothetical protein [Nocardiopsaceae bacterium]